MALYQVENQWGGSSAPWNQGGKWILGARANQNVVAIDIQSTDNGETLNGTMTYADEGPIGFRATRCGSNNYTVENHWGDPGSPWHPGGTWIIGFRTGQNVVALKVTSDDGGNSLNGTMTYANEGPIGFKSSISPGDAYSVENHWGGSGEPWHPGGEWAIGARDNQKVIAIDITSDDEGKTLKGTMTYENEGPIGFKGTLIGSNNYTVENHWGGSGEPWHPGGLWVIGYRVDQNVVSLKFDSSDGGDTLNGTMTYNGEGPIGFKGALSAVTEEVAETAG